MKLSKQEWIEVITLSITASFLVPNSGIVSLDVVISVMTAMILFTMWYIIKFLNRF